MRNLLFRWTVLWFRQFENRKILGASIMTTLVAIVAFLLVISYGYDAVKDIPLFTTTPTIILTCTWTLLLIGWVFNAELGKKATLEMRDKYWRTQLVRFKYPKYLPIKQKYPNWKARQRELETMWLKEYGVSYDDSRQPFIGQIISSC